MIKIILLILILINSCSTEREADKQNRIKKECRNESLALTIYGNSSIDTICKNVNSNSRKNKTENECIDDLRQTILIFTISSSQICISQRNNDYLLRPP